jgi:hypothetical protein
MENMLSRETMVNILQDVQIVLEEGPLLIMRLFMQIVHLIVPLNGLLLGNPSDFSHTPTRHINNIDYITRININIIIF